MASDPNNILSRMEVPSEPRIFILGSLESRITLFSQQVRALNLIFALEQKNLIVHGANNETCNDLAVIGGGVGGLTVAAAAVNRGFRVTIFERAGILVPLQRTNYTRWLHPNIYDWPRPGSENPDAGLPLLNWEANTTRSVISRILDEWKRFQDHVNIVRKVHDIKIEKMHSPNDAVRRITWNEKDGFRSQLFGIVVLAIGFGLERGVAGQPATAYWQNDDLNQRDPKGADLHILISGTGDGGLIDLCRAKIEDFVHHEIVHKILNNPELDSIKRELLEIEEEAFNTSDEDRMNDRYQALSSSAPNSVKETFRNCLRDDTKILLNSGSNLPLNMRACVLNRFLASLLLQMGVKFHSAQIKGVKKQGSLFTVEYDSGEQMYFDRVIIRHGPEPELRQSFPHFSDACRAKSYPPYSDPTREKSWPDDYYTKEEHGTLISGIEMQNRSNQIESVGSDPMSISAKDSAILVVRLKQLFIEEISQTKSTYSGQQIYRLAYEAWKRAESGAKATDIKTESEFEEATIDNYIKVVAYCSVAIKRGYKKAAVFYLLGCGHYALNERGEASTAFKRAVELAPRFHKARLALANLLFSEREITRAKEEFERVAREAPAGSKEAIIASNYLSIIRHQYP